MGKSAQTIGYWYKLAIHFGLCRGPIDALLEIRGGDRAAWTGAQYESGTISINAPNLWGGEKSEGGIVSDFDVMMGEADQAPNDYLTSIFGGVQSAFRGLVTGVFKGGKYGAFNPYPKPMAFKVRRIFEGWDGGECWYPAKASIPITESGIAVSGSVAPGDTWKYLSDATGLIDASGVAFDDSAWAIGAGGFGTAAPGGGWPVGTPLVAGVAGRKLWIRRTLELPAGANVEITALADDGSAIFWNGVYVGGFAYGVTDSLTIDPGDVLEGVNVLAAYTLDVHPSNVFLGVSVEWDGEIDTGLKAMNPAHILYDSITSLDGQGEPVGLINEASFMAAADALHAEGFGLCLTYDGQETIEDFQQRICDIIGACITQSRVNGQYYLDLIRGDYDPEDLLVLTEADVLEFSQEPAVVTEAVNQVLVDWFDVETRQDRTTSPAQSLGLIASNGVISETRSYRPIPYEDLANRVAERDRRALSTPQSRFNLVCNRKPYALRPGQPFRLQMPSEGITDLVCRLGSIDHGTLTDGRIRIVAVQDVFTLPAAVSVVDVPGDSSPPGSVAPAPAAAERVLEAPYIDLASRLAVADLSALDDSASFLLTLGVRPDALTHNHSLFTAADGEAYADRGLADWCPSALVVESATPDPAEIAFTLASGVDLESVEVGQAALWGDELVRVDAIDPDAGTVELARGCGDAVPAEHAANQRIWFYQDFAGADGRQYADGELVHAKLLTRTSSAELALADATELSVTMAGRAARPYAPGQFEVNGSPVPTSESGALAVTWAHRSRLIEGNQLLESAAAGVGPEPGTQYVVTLKNNLGAVLHESDPISDTSYTFTFTYTGTATIELKAIRGALESWQIHSRTFAYTGVTTSIPPVTPGPSEDLAPLDGTELVAIEQDGIAKECTTQAIANLAHRLVVASGADTITGTIDPALTLADGLELAVRAAAANTGPATFNGLPLTKLGGTALAAGDIAAAGHELRIRYRASVPRWELLNLASTLAASGVTPGSYTNADVTVNAQGIVTAIANGSAGGGGSGASIGLASQLANLPFFL